MPKVQPVPGVYAYPHGKQPAWRIKVAAGPDPSRPGKYLEHREVFRGSVTEANKRHAAIVTDIARKVHHQAAGATFAETIEAYLEDRRAAGRERRTLQSYEELARLWLIPACGSVAIGKLRNTDLNRAYAAMTAAGLSPARVERAHAVARGACRKAMAWGWIDRDPTLGVTRPTVRRKEVRPPTLEQLGRLLAEMAREDVVLGVMTVFAATVGTRRGETCAVRWSDLLLPDDDAEDLTGSVTIRRSIDQESAKVWHEKDTKTHQVRTVLLAPGLVALLKQHRLDLAQRTGVEVPPDAFVFPSIKSLYEPRMPDHVTAAFVRARGRAKVPGARTQDLRHLSATLLAAQGVDKWTIVQRLGWANAAMFDTVYGHAMPGAGDQAATAIESALGDVFLALPAAPHEARGTDR